MKDIIIVGASGFGREILWYLEDINNIKPTWNILGFLDDNLNALDGYNCQYPILGTIKDYVPLPNQEFICALAFPKVKKQIIETLKSKGALFTKVIHPSVRINPNSEIGEGVVITPGSVISDNAKIGDFVSLLGSSVAHDATIDDWSTLSGKCSVNGHAKVGKSVYMGCGVLVAPSKKIGDNSTVGIGSVVISNIKAGSTVFGNPAKKIDF